MNKKDILEAFIALGQQIPSYLEQSGKSLFSLAYSKNKWFDEQHCKLAFEGIIHLLNKQKLSKWLNSYDVCTHKPKKIGIVAAGNIPMVAFHDILCVLAAGHIACIKLSSKDEVLSSQLLKWLIDINSNFQERIVLQENLKNLDAYIATGSNNTSRYFEYYFSNYPHIIRKNRTSCAVISGQESKDVLQKLGQDIFQYYGLGCRNVSKLFVPKGYDFNVMVQNWGEFATFATHNKYANNYDYTKAIYLLNKEPHLDTGFLLLRESEAFASPTAVVFYEYYDNVESVKQKIAIHQEEIQCVVSDGAWFEGSIPIGTAQKPELTDYADNVDTMMFLVNLN